MKSITLYLELLVKVESSQFFIEQEDYQAIGEADLDWVEYEKKFFQFTILPCNVALGQIKQGIETILKRKFEVIKATWLQPKKEITTLAAVPFEVFWEHYAHKVGAKNKAQKLWKGLEAETQHYIAKHLLQYRKVVVSQPYPTTFLNQRHWESEDWLKPPRSMQQSTPQEEKIYYTPPKR